MATTLSRRKLSGFLRRPVLQDAVEQQPVYVGLLQHDTLDEEEMTLAQLPNFPMAVYRGDGQLFYHGNASRAGLERLSRRMWPAERAVAVLDANRRRYNLSLQDSYTTGFINQEEMRTCADWVLVGGQAFRVESMGGPIVDRSAIGLLLQ